MSFSVEELLAIPHTDYIFNDQLTAREWSDFLTDLMKFKFMSQGTLEQQGAAREWFRKHYSGIAGNCMVFTIEREIAGEADKKVEFKVDVQAMVNAQGEVDVRNTELALLRSRVLDQETSIEILSEMNRDLEIELARLRNENVQPSVPGIARPSSDF